MTVDIIIISAMYDRLFKTYDLRHQRRVICASGLGVVVFYTTRRIVELFRSSILSNFLLKQVRRINIEMRVFQFNTKLLNGF